MSNLKDQAEANPEKFWQEYPSVAFAAYQAAETKYKSMCLWKRSDLRAICEENWPAFVEES